MRRTQCLGRFVLMLMVGAGWSSAAAQVPFQVDSGPALQRQSLQAIRLPPVEATTHRRHDSLERPAPAPVVGLTLAALEQRGLANNPSVAQAAAAVQEAYGNWVQVGLPPNPTVSYAGVEMNLEGTSGQQGGQISQQFVTAGKLQLDRNVALQKYRIAQQQLEAQRLRVLTDVRQSYYQALIAQRRLELAGDLLGISQELLDTTQKLLDAGETGRLELLQARLELNSTRINARNAENAYLGTWRQLAAVVGEPQLPPQPLVGNPAELPPAWEWEQALARLLAESPTLAAARLQAEQARWQLKRADAEVVPDVFVQSAVQHDDPSSDTVFGLQAGIAVPLFDRNQGARLAAEAQIAAAERGIQRVALGLQEQLAGVYQRYATARDQAVIYQNEILPTADENLQIARQAYRARELEYLSLLTMQTSYFRANMNFLSALDDLWAAEMELRGLLLSESLQDRSQ